MIKCNVTVCGVIGRNASIRTNKEGKTFLVFPLRVMIPDTDGKTMPIEVDVSKDTAGEEVSNYRNGSRVEVSGTMYLKHRGDKLYFNLFINEIRTATALLHIPNFQIHNGTKGMGSTSIPRKYPRISHEHAKIKW